MDRHDQKVVPRKDSPDDGTEKRDIFQRMNNLERSVERAEETFWSHLQEIKSRLTSLEDSSSDRNETLLKLQKIAETFGDRFCTLEKALQEHFETKYSKKIRHRSTSDESNSDACNYCKEDVQISEILEETEDHNYNVQIRLDDSTAPPSSGQVTAKDLIESQKSEDLLINEANNKYSVHKRVLHGKNQSEYGLSTDEGIDSLGLCDSTGRELIGGGESICRNTQWECLEENESDAHKSGRIQGNLSIVLGQAPKEKKITSKGETGVSKFTYFTLRDPFGFKRRITESEDDNRVVVYAEQSNSPAFWASDIRKSRIVDKGQSNININEEFMTDVQENQDEDRFAMDEISSVTEADLFRAQNDDVENWPDQQSDIDTWFRLADNEAKKGVLESMKPGGRGPNTCILLDISESMSGRPFQQMIQAAKAIVNGIARVAAMTSCNENIAVATFGHETRVLLYLSNNYTAIRNQLDYLVTGGHSPMAAGLLMGLAGCIANGFGVRINGEEFYPRIILMSDGKATIDSTVPIPDRTSSRLHEELVRPFVSRVCSQLNRRQIRVFWVPIGNSPESTIPDIVLSLTKGKKIPASQVDRLVEATKLKLFAKHLVQQYPGLESDVSVERLKLLSQSIHVTNFEDLKEMIVEIQNPTSNTFLDVPDPWNPDVDYRELDPGMPQIGTRVRRGPSWRPEYGLQDGGGPGTVVGHSQIAGVTGGLWVEWDIGHINVYQYNVFSQQVRVVDEPRQLLPGQRIATGCIVQRGRGWESGEGDVGPGNVGVVFRTHRNGRVGVRWSNRRLGYYKYGCDGIFEVTVITSNQMDNKDVDTESRSDHVDALQNRLKSSKNNFTSDSEKQIHASNALNKENEKKIKERENKLTGVWEYQVGADTWQSYPEAISEKLEKAYGRNKKGTPIIELNGELSRVLFSKGIEVNQKTKAERKVRRLDVDESEKPEN